VSFTILIDAVIGFTLLEMLGLWARQGACAGSMGA